MQDGQTGAEPVLEPLTELRRQADFRNKDQGRLPRSEEVFDQAKVDLGLAAPGDTVKQHGVESIVPDDRLKCPER